MIAAHVTRRILAVFVSIAAFVGAVSAHQQKAALTEVLFNSRTGNIEVAHRFNMHDAEHAARLDIGLDGDLYGSPETQSAFAAYVAKRFALVMPDNTPLPLVLLGAEVKDGYLWVYQETPAPDALDRLWVRHDALRDIWPDQTNRVNVKRDDEIESLIFTGRVKFLQVKFEG